MSQPIIYNEFSTASGHKLIIATLNSEPTLNSLSLPMLTSLTEKLIECEKDPLTMAIWLQGTGVKAFCAGGDIRRLYEAMVAKKAGNFDSYPEEFFEAEYGCDYRLRCYPKPIICWGHGIVMGGGLGLLEASKFRIVTESSRLAMPEISIGLYPDVGGTYFLSKIKNGIGLYLGLTGARMNGHDAIVTGLATHFIKSDLKGQILSAIQNESFTMSVGENRDKLQTIFQTFADKSKADLPPSEISKHLDFIKKAVQFPTLLELAAAWKPHLDSSDPWIKSGMTNFFRGSPTSAMVIFEQLKRAGELATLKDVYMRELSMTLHFSRSADFMEGIRALIVDKDNKPRWTPATLKEVTPQMVEKFFSTAFPTGTPNPLEELPGTL